MKLKFVLLTVAAITCVACSEGGAAGGSKGELASEAECRAIFEKGLELQGAPLAAVAELVDMGVQECLDSGKVTKEDYRCVMAASSSSEAQRCNIKTW